jgi:poly-gamma-glutamate capsule biosynthesis protein CapA/YwtB (metallophosphatase superfamily)
MPHPKPQTVDGGKRHRPRSFVRCLASIFCLLAIVSSACQSRRVVTLALLGDLMLGRGVNPAPDSLAYLTTDLSAADLALANLESPLAPLLPASDSTNNLCASSVRANLLPAWGLDLLSLANNHRLDCGPDGPAVTISALNNAGVASIGPGMQPVYREVNGLRLAFLAFDDISSPLDENAAVQAIRSARLTGALVIVSVHWGAEYQGGASDRQKSLALQFAEAGAVLIWGHHPHVLQPAAWIETRQGKTLVLFSLGNVLFDQGGLDDTRQSALVLVTFDADGVTGVGTVPFEIDVVNSRVFQPDAGTAENIRAKVNLP